MSAAPGARCPRAPPFVDPPGYARHRPESTLLYRLVEQHYPAFRELRAESGRPLPVYVQQEFEAYLVLEPLDLMARLAALVPPPRMHLTRYHGVFAPHSRLRAAVTVARALFGHAVG